ncbi:MAG: glycoside hydrolase family 130 protein [Phycisphaerales bacterium]
MPARASCQIQVTRHPDRFISDDRRVITRFFQVGDEARVMAVLRRVAALDDAEVVSLLERVIHDFGDRHRRIEDIFEHHFDFVRPCLERPEELSRERRLLIGSYFTMEYSIESAALFNPSIVPHPDQSGMDDDEVKFIMSLRATGEGHVSSIVFRTGKVDNKGEIIFDPPSKYAARLRMRTDQVYEKNLFFYKLIEMAAYNETARNILDAMPEFFTYRDLDHTVAQLRSRPNNPATFNETAENMLWLARSNYHLLVPPDADPSEIVIFPTSENESKGIEDLRLTRFIDDDGKVTYFGTYTAYNGFRILPQLIETDDFTNIKVHTLNGKYVQNKGMALFPRRIDGMYHMVSRLDGENMFLMKSDNTHFWNEAVKLQAPRYPWEFVQIGNCGPPIETEAGWVLLTHGVGPMRQYCIGASLLDLNDPTKIIGHLKDPLIVPQANEREGYVPNVVYTCGALLNGDLLLIPYAVSDSATTFATTSMSDLVGALTGNGGLS